MLHARGRLSVRSFLFYSMVQRAKNLWQNGWVRSTDSLRMQFLIEQDDTNEIILDSDRAPTPFERHNALIWYRDQPHHAPNAPERNRRVKLFAVEFAGRLCVQAFAAERLARAACQGRGLVRNN
jgi:hypothetical protein